MSNIPVGWRVSYDWFVKARTVGGGAIMVLRISFGMLIWGAALGGALSISQLPGDWGHGVCGPWGCGPPLQALAACHLTWMVTLVPPVALLAASPRLSPRTVRLVGYTLILTAVVALLAVVAYQRIVWWPAVTDWHREFFWQRCGFCLMSAVDLPVIQTFLVGMAAFLWAGRRRQRSENRA